MFKISMFDSAHTSDLKLRFLIVSLELFIVGYYEFSNYLI